MPGRSRDDSGKFKTTLAVLLGRAMTRTAEHRGGRKPFGIALACGLRLALTAMLLLALSPTRVAASGSPGPAFRVNTSTQGNQSQPAVARNALGNIVVVWASSDQFANASGIFAQRFDAT